MVMIVSIALFKDFSKLFSLLPMSGTFLTPKLNFSFARNIATKYLYRPVIGDAQEINFLQSFQLSQLGKKNVVNVFTIQCASPSQQKNSQLLLTNY